MGMAMDMDMAMDMVITYSSVSKVVRERQEKACIQSPMFGVASS